MPKKLLYPIGYRMFHLITTCEGVLPAFYERSGFKKEERVTMMGKE